MEKDSPLARRCHARGPRHQDRGRGHIPAPGRNAPDLQFHRRGAGPKPRLRFPRPRASISSNAPRPQSKPKPAGRPGSSNNRPKRPSASWPNYSANRNRMQPYWERVSCHPHSKAPLRFLTINPSPSEAMPNAARPRAVLLETLRLEEMERRRRSLRTEPLVLSYRNADPDQAGADDAGTGRGSPVTTAGYIFGAGSGRPGRRHSRRVHFHGRGISPTTHRTQRPGTGRAGRARAGGGGYSPFSCPGAARDGNSRRRAGYRSGRLGAHL